MANVAFGAGNVCLNAWLGAIGRGEWKRSQRRQVVEETASLSSENERSGREGVSPNPPNREEDEKEIGAMTSKISARGIALGYLAGILCLVVTIVPVTLMKGSTWSLRLANGLSGIWWGVFSIRERIFWSPRLTIPGDQTYELMLSSSVPSFL